jgi:hypothetical protein
LSELVVNPGELRRLADRIGGAAARAAGINGRAVDGQGSANRSQFPARAEGQQIAADWEKARSTFVDGISLVRSSLDRFSAGVQAAANQYEQTDSGAAADIGRSGRSRNRAE